MFHFLHSQYNKCLLERERYFLQEKSDGSNHLAYYSPSNGFLVRGSIFYVVLCEQYIKNSEMFHRILQEKKK